MKRRFEATPREEILRDYPIEDVSAPGWYFRIDEVSANVCRVDGRDAYERRVSRTGVDDEALLKQCVSARRGCYGCPEARLTAGTPTLP
jgi:hypothetical protein